MFQKINEPVQTFVAVEKLDCTTYPESGGGGGGDAKPIELKFIVAAKSLSPSERQAIAKRLMSSYQIPESLDLKKGAVVMCTVNWDMDAGICNGAQGMVVDFRDGFPVVRFHNGVVRALRPHHVYSEEYPSIAVSYIPLCLSWAITIHKMQGATLPMAEMDLGASVFEYGQTYVALSRLQSLDGLYLSSFRPERVRANPKVVAFYQTIEEGEEEEEKEEEEEEEEEEESR
jgi:ATP-dependent DNA helicase PIF1